METTHYPFYAILFAICFLATLAAVLAFFGKYTESIGFAGLTTGLIGVIRMPTTRQTVTVDNSASDPVPVESK